MIDNYRPKVLVLYASTHGQTAKIASRLAASLGTNDVSVELLEAKSNGDAKPEDYDAVVVAASVHADHHQREIVNWVHDNLFELGRRPNAFLSVSLTAAEDDDESRDTARKLIEDFERDTNWYPRRSESVAGALQYREYNPFARTLMRLMMKKGGHPTDTSHDYDYTDWEAVARLGEELAGDFKAALAPESEVSSAS